MIETINKLKEELKETISESNDLNNTLKMRLHNANELIDMQMKRILALEADKKELELALTRCWDSDGSLK